MVEEILKKSGWFEGRVYSTDSYRKVLQKESYVLFDKAEVFLKEFGGLEISYSNPRKNSNILILQINPTKAVESVFRSVSERYEKHIGEALIIVGEIEQMDMTIYVSETGHFYGGYDDCLIKLGNCFAEALNNLVNGVKLETMIVE